MQPTFKVQVQNGSDITQLIADRLVEIQITDRAGVKSDTVSIEIDDRDQRLQVPKTGAKLEVWLGYIGGALVKIGTYAVDEVEMSGPLRTMTIRGNAADMNGGIKSPKERSWHGVTFGDLAQKIGKENELKVSISQKLANIKLEHIDQTESDMQLLSRLCAENSATMKVSDGRLVIAEHASGKSNSGKDLPKLKLDGSACGSWSASISKRNKYGSVIAYWQDVGIAKRENVVAGEGKPSLTLKHSYKSEDEAQRAAESKLNALRRGGGTVSIRGMVGDPTYSAECEASLSGFREGVDGDGWIVNQVTHSLTNSGYTCSLELEAK